MAKSLTQQEIDAMVGAARRGQSLDDVQPTRSVQSCNFRAAGQLSNEHARTLTAIHEGFARNVTNSIGAYLRSAFEMVLSSLEQLAFRDYLAGLQTNAGYVVPLIVNPGDSAVLLQTDLALAFPIIDLLLGGMGSPAPQGRELTEIDEEIMQGISGLFARQLEGAWQGLGVSIKTDKCLKSSQLQQFFPAAEKVILITFEVRTAGTTGTLNLIFPASFANNLLRQISNDPKHRSKMRFFARPSLRDRVYDCEFVGTVGLPTLRLKVRDLLQLKPGSVLKLRIPVRNPGYLMVEGRELFEAVPVRSGMQRAAQLLKQVTHQLPEETQK